MNENMGEIICQCRQNKKMTQEEFASRLGVTPQAVSKWERGNGLPDISLIEGICKILDISANALLEINDNKVIENNNISMEQEIKNNMFAEPLLAEFGEDIIPCVAAGLKTDYINQKRKELVKNTGILIPILRLRDNTQLGKNSYRILSYDQVLFEGSLDVHSETAYRELIDRVAIECQKHYHTILNKQLVKTIVETFKELFPGIADDLVPEKISYLQLQRKLQSILKQGKSIRDMTHILEEMEEDIK